MQTELVRKLKRFDERRPEIPGEHWLTFAAGVGLWLATRRHPSLAIRIVAGVVGGMLVARSAGGRKVPSALQKWLPYAHRPGARA